MLKAIFLDMDNTLLETEELYDQAKFRLFDHLADFGILREEAVAVFDRIDRELYKTYGYSRLRQPQIFEDTVKHFAPDADAEMINNVRNWAEAIFISEARLKEGVLESIELLSALYPVYIVTAGDIGVQEDRVAKLPFLDKISGIHIVEKKDKGVYEDVLAKTGLEARHVLMAGDSLKSDILPAVEAGMIAIWIEAHNFQMEKVALEQLPEGAHKFESLFELSQHIAAHGKIVPVAKPAAKSPEPKP